jgi:hypothetical protein
VVDLVGAGGVGEHHGRSGAWTFFAQSTTVNVRASGCGTPTALGRRVGVPGSTEFEADRDHVDDEDDRIGFKAGAVERGVPGRLAPHLGRVVGGLGLCVDDLSAFVDSGHPDDRAGQLGQRNPRFVAGLDVELSWGAY